MGRLFSCRMYNAIAGPKGYFKPNRLKITVYINGLQKLPSSISCFISRAELRSLSKNLDTKNVMFSNMLQLLCFLLYQKPAAHAENLNTRKIFKVSFGHWSKFISFGLQFEFSIPVQCHTFFVQLWNLLNWNWNIINGLRVYLVLKSTCCLRKEN